MYSTAYIKQLQSLHADKTRPQGFGGKVKSLGKFYKYFETWNCETTLDYGCGKGNILNHLQQKYSHKKFSGYDPAVPEYSKQPTGKYDCVFSNDVLEHIEPEFIAQVLQHINKISNKYIWLRIDTKPARKTLSDGRNAHLILKDKVWWEDIILANIEGNIIYSNLNDKGKLDVAISK